MRTTASHLILLALLAAGCGADPAPVQPSEVSAAVASDLRTSPASVVTVENQTGSARTINVSGGPVIDPSNPFFQPLGSNGRSCATCHDARDNMTVTPARLRARFTATGGTDPIFRLVDGASSPNADVSTVRARRAAYGMLLSKGLIRVGLGIPADAEFELVDVRDPYGYASAAELSLFRRPLPSTNLRFLSTVMWDGRETFKDPTQPTGFAPLAADLADQSNAATLTHAQGTTPLTDAQRQAIVGFELQLFTAQLEDDRAGDLTGGGATGGPVALSTRPFTFGMNDPLDGGPFDPVAMTDFAAWSSSSRAARASVARGEALFDTLPISITGVSGLNDDLGVAAIQGTCTTCHDTPHAGSHSVPAPLRIGTDDPAPLGGLDASGLPVYTLRNKATGQLAATTDPGRALVTGKWKDVGRFKGPVLRGLAGRAPYFHNGSAPDLATVVSFYDQRFGLGLTAQQKADLVAFLQVL
jgi:cytochrome c peroxidase